MKTLILSLLAATSGLSLPCRAVANETVRFICEGDKTHVEQSQNELGQLTRTTVQSPIGEGPCDTMGENGFPTVLGDSLFLANCGSHVDMILKAKTLPDEKGEFQATLWTSVGKEELPLTCTL